MESVKNSKNSAFQLLSQQQRYVFFILLFLIVSGTPSLRWLMSLFTMEQIPGVYGFAFQVICLFGILFLFHRVGAVRTRYIALLASILAACLALAYRG